jgi:hypothetical protein
MMKRTTAQALASVLATALALTAAGSSFAARTMLPKEDAYEVLLGDVVLPSGAGGSVVFSPCTDCSSLSFRVTAQTGYLFNSTAVALADLKLAALEADPGSTGVYVFVDRDTTHVSRIAIDTFGR